MRRMYAYITLIAGTILTLAVNFMSVASSLNTNLEFSSGREFVYRLSDKEDATASLSDDAASAMAETMKDRLETANVTRYDVVVEGQNQVRVTLSEANETRYKRIKTLLAFDGEFSICTVRDTCAVGDEMFDASVARVEYTGQVPFIVIPLSDATNFKENLLQEAQTIADESGNNADGSSPSGQLLLWANRTEADTYEASKNDTKVSEKIIVRYDITDLWWDNEDSGEIKSPIKLDKYGTKGADGTYGIDVVTQGNDEANYFVNLFNASPLDYSVEFLFETNVPASIEPLLVLSEDIALNFSSTALVLASGLLVTLVLLVVFFGMAGLSVWVTELLALAIALAAYVQIGIEFSSATLFGLVLAFAVGLFAALPFMLSLKNELYKGRNLKKSFAEATAVSLVPNLEIDVAFIAFSLVLYLLGGNLLQNLAAFTMIASVTHFALGYFGSQWLFSILAYEPKLNQRLSWFGVKPSHVANASKDQKQTYFGRFAKRDFSKKNLLITLTTALLAVTASLAVGGLLLLNEPMYQSTTTTVQSRLYFEIREGASIENTGDVEDGILPFLIVDGEPFVYSEVTFHDLTRIENEVSVDYRFYVVESTVPYSPTSVASFDDGSIIIAEQELQDVLTDLAFAFDNGDSLISITAHAITASVQQPLIEEILLGTFVAIAVLGLLVSLRYGLAKGLALTIDAVLVAIIAIAFLSVLRIPTSNTVAFGALLGAMVTFVLGIVLYARQRAILKDTKVSDATVDQEMSALNLASSRSLGTMLVPLISIALMTALFIFFGADATRTLFASGLIGLTVSLLLVVTNLTALIRPVLGWTRPLIAALTTQRLNKNKSGSEQVRSSEPQEATFIGIND